MKILTVHGSPDTDGNSAKLLNACISGMNEIEGTQVESINIYDYDVAPVWKDYFGDVMRKETDKVKDDMSVLISKMLDADLIVLSSPVYWYSVSGKMKLFLDRWSDLINPDWSSRLKGKGLALLSTHSGVLLMNSSNLLQMAMKATAEFLGMTWMGGVDMRSQMPWPWDDENALVESKRFGNSLAQGMNLIGQPSIKQ